MNDSDLTGDPTADDLLELAREYTELDDRLSANILRSMALTTSKFVSVMTQLDLIQTKLDQVITLVQRRNS